MASEYLKVALQAVKEAEKVILKYLDTGIRAELKEDLSPVTVADRQAEEIIKNTIRVKFPDHTFYGEEGEKVSLDQHSGFTWIIDPIDGTKSYLRASPLFATELALLHDGELVLGVSNAPLLHELMYAEKGEGCYLNGKVVSVSEVDSLGNAYMSFGSLKYFVRHATIEQLLSLAEKVQWAKGIGDFWSYHLLAQGKLDIMIEADTKLWDIAALKVIVEEAGGTFTQLDGQPINPTSTTALATSGPIHQAVLDQFKTPGNGKP
jgi:histidinol-phosphatase